MYTLFFSCLIFYPSRNDLVKNFPGRIHHFYFYLLKGVILVILSSVLFYLHWLYSLAPYLSYFKVCSRDNWTSTLLSNFERWLLIYQLLVSWFVWLDCKIYLRFASKSRQLWVFLFEILFPSLLELFSVIFSFSWFFSPTYTFLYLLIQLYPFKYPLFNYLFTILWKKNTKTNTANTKMVPGKTITTNLKTTPHITPTQKLTATETEATPHRATAESTRPRIKINI